MLIRLLGTLAQTNVRVDSYGTLVRGPLGSQYMYVIRLTNTVFYGSFLLKLLFLEILSLISLVPK